MSHCGRSCARSGRHNYGAFAAFNALRGLEPVKSSEIVLIQGTDGLATFALQLVVAVGVETIVTSSSYTAGNYRNGQKLTATVTVDYRLPTGWSFRRERHERSHLISRLIRKISDMPSLIISFYY
ncbi:hypothetical protein DFH09DRAFT_1089848 [Mycena vulgaris]|nr:hypothetical protein DFH09DRAFT_1089848 [Mycena vulgaris]